MFFAISDTSPLCGGLTEYHNGGKLCANRDCGVSKHAKSLYGYLMPNHAYLILSGSGRLHPPPIFKYKGFAPDTITKLKQTSLTYNGAANVRYMSNKTL